MAIEQALSILNWHENLSKEDIPPEHLWEDSEGLDLWWADVEERRNRRYGIDSSSDGTQDERPEMVQNDLARTLKGG